MSDAMVLSLFEKAIWPVVGLVLGLVALAVFRPNIAKLLDRIRKFGPVEADVGAVTAQAESTPAKKEKPKHDLRFLVAQAKTSSVATDNAADIRRALADNGMKVESPDTAEALLWIAAALATVREYEEINSVIFASQIALLRRLNSARFVGLSKKEIGEYFAAVKAASPAGLAEWDTAKYMSYILESKLIAFDGEKTEISPKGIEYLKWLADTGRSEGRPL